MKKNGKTNIKSFKGGGRIGFSFFIVNYELNSDYPIFFEDKNRNH